jgi:hypothetical protein
MYAESNLPLFIHTSLKKIMLMGEAANIDLFVKKKKLPFPSHLLFIFVISMFLHTS